MGKFIAIPAVTRAWANSADRAGAVRFAAEADAVHSAGNVKRTRMNCRIIPEQF
jgi:hypothetical protein